MRFVYFLALSIVLLSVGIFAQQKYRTFTQEQLAQKSDRYAGRSIGSDVSFVMKNIFDEPKNLLTAHLSSPIVALLDSGGFPNVRLANYRTTVIAEGKVLQPGDSVVFHAIVKRIVKGTKVTGWQMRMKDAVASAPMKQNLMPGSSVSTISITHGLISTAIFPYVDRQIFAQPSGGNVRDYVYQKEIKKPTGIILGIQKAPNKAGWIRSFRSELTGFPHTGTPRCLDSFLVSTKKKAFSGELRNPTVRVHNNRLVGSLHALKLAVVANDSMVTEPFDPDATPFGKLIYFDSTNVNDRFNNYTIEQICALADSALTFCARYTPDVYSDLDQAMNRILNAFAGTVEVVTMKPLKVLGVRSLDEVPFLHENPAAMTNVPRRKADTAVETTPLQNGMMENYPNPFNPLTTISFTLSSQSLVTLKVFNVLGQEVSTLLDHADLEEGEHGIEFEANSLPSGTYYYRIMATNPENGNIFTDVKKMTLIK